MIIQMTICAQKYLDQLLSLFYFFIASSSLSMMAKITSFCFIKPFNCGKDYNGNIQTLTNQFRYSGLVTLPSTQKTIEKSICCNKQILTTFETHPIKVIYLHTFDCFLSFNFNKCTILKLLLSHLSADLWTILNLLRCKDYTMTVVDLMVGQESR